MAPQAKILVVFHRFFNRKRGFVSAKTSKFSPAARYSKNLIKPLILVKIGAEGAGKFWGFGTYSYRFISPPLLFPDLQYGVKR